MADADRETWMRDLELLTAAAAHLGDHEPTHEQWCAMETADAACQGLLDPAAVARVAFAT